MATQQDDGTRSAWMDVPAPNYAPLNEDTTADVCIVGAGIAGMTTAHALTAEGKNVVVLDDGPVGGGMTRRTTAHLSNAIDDRYLRIERLHGRDGARIAAESHTAAIDRIESIVQEEQIDCDFERLDGYLVVRTHVRVLMASIVAALAMVGGSALAVSFVGRAEERRLAVGRKRHVDRLARRGRERGDIDQRLHLGIAADFGGHDAAVRMCHEHHVPGLVLDDAARVRHVGLEGGERIVHRDRLDTARREQRHDLVP